MKPTAILVMSIVLAPLLARADGGAVQFRAASGSFIVTVFTQPESLRVGPVDTSVLIQERETEEVILDATVNVVFQHGVGADARTISGTRHSRARNKLLQSFVIDLPAPGWWSVRVFVSRGTKEAVVATNLLVMPSPPRLAAIWPFLTIPPFAIGIFVLHQILRRKHWSHQHQENQSGTAR